MQAELAPKASVWRGRGRVRRQVPQVVKDMADSTYRTGKVYVLVVESGEEEELRELLGYLNSYANSLGRRMRVQREDDIVRFEMVDRVKRQKRVAA